MMRPSVPALLLLLAALTTRAEPVAFVNVNVIPMESPQVLEAQTKHQKDYLSSQATQQKKQFEMQIEMEVKQQEMALEQQKQEQMMALQQQAAQQGLATAE